jgi:hypothetical protein
MPEGVELLETFIKDIALINHSQLTLEERKKDTETIDGQFYNLPRGILIWIKLYSVTINGGQEWGTMRRYTKEKFEYYKGLIGQQVKIIVEEKS